MRTALRSGCAPNVPTSKPLSTPADQGRDERVVALNVGLAGLLRVDGPWALALHTIALTAARSLGDRLGQASALNQLEGVRGLTGDYRGAVRDLEAALQQYRDLGDRLGQANAMTELGDLRGRTGDYRGAVRDLGRGRPVRHARAGADGLPRRTRLHPLPRRHRHPHADGLHLARPDQGLPLLGDAAAHRHPDGTHAHPLQAAAGHPWSPARPRALSG